MNEPVVTVEDAPDERRFEIRVDGELAGFARYARRPGRIIFVHTEIDDRFEGQGLAGRLIAGALDSARAAGERVVPLCPFVASYIERHPAYEDLVDHALLDALAHHPQG
jgi:hypothetical protein